MGFLTTFLVAIYAYGFSSLFESNAHVAALGLFLLAYLVISPSLSFNHYALSALAIIASIWIVLLALGIYSPSATEIMLATLLPLAFVTVVPSSFAMRINDLFALGLIVAAVGILDILTDFNQFTVQKSFFMGDIIAQDLGFGSTVRASLIVLSLLTIAEFIPKPARKQYGFVGTQIVLFILLVSTLERTAILLFIAIKACFLIRGPFRIHHQNGLIFMAIVALSVLTFSFLDFGLNAIDDLLQISERGTRFAESFTLVEKCILCFDYDVWSDGVEHSIRRTTDFYHVLLIRTFGELGACLFLSLALALSLKQRKVHLLFFCSSVGLLLKRIGECRAIPRYSFCWF